MGATRQTGRPRRAWWPLLLVPAAVAAGVASRPLGLGGLLAKPPHELIGPPILALAVLLLAWRARRGGEQLFAWLTALAAIFLLRELHFAGSDAITGVGLALLAVWAALQRRELRAAVRSWPHAPWLFAALLGYALSQAVARRAFRGLPGERGLHIGIEELLETTAHGLFLVAALLSALRARRRDAGVAPCTQQSAPSAPTTPTSAR